ncbi:plasmid partitioning-family protein [Sphingomonas sp. LH128]|uniref:ParA family protein n=1 Tax=Sphingomonas sp. LH128 TaxID=473781 RepID=UPI00027CC94B|nr:ParA family protein [Sphingomonas sp. LH128]EJU14240.1 plasmid partitioning-family protein [Sphingomonas sp. LH128]
MKIISLAANKGGVGKTLMAASLAVLAQQDCEAEEGVAGKGKVAMFDLDPQGSLTAWYNARQRDGPLLVTPMLRTLALRLYTLNRKGVRYAFIDTPPGYSEYSGKAVDVADLVFVPVRPGELDYKAVLRNLQPMLFRAQTIVALPNAGLFRSRSMGDLVRRLDAERRDRLAPVHHRIDLPLKNGLTLPETQPNSAGAQELRRIWAQIRERLGA